MPKRNSALVLAVVKQIVEFEQTFHKEHGRYGRLDDLPKDTPELREVRNASSVFGHTVELTADEDHFGLVIKPLQWGITGFVSLYVDESLAVRETFAEDMDPRNAPVVRRLPKTAQE